MRVIVVGGGIAGMSTAIAVRKKDMKPSCWSRRRIDPLGAGITLFANAMRALDRLGLARR